MRHARLQLHAGEGEPVIRRSIVLAIVLASSRAHADKAAADAAFDDAKRLVAAGKIAEACPKFEVSYNEDPQLGSLLNLADCHERVGRLATARAEFRSAIELAHRLRDAREKYASSRAAALDGRVAHVVLHAQPGVQVRLDDRDVTAMLDSDLPIDAGHHVLATKSSAGAWTGPLDVEADGVRRELVVPPVGEAPAPSPASAPPPHVEPAQPMPAQPMPAIIATDPGVRHRRHVLAVELGAGGIVAGGVGLFFGSRAFSDYNHRFEACADGNGPCIEDQIHAATNAATVSDVACGVGIAALAAAAIVWFTAPDERVTVAPVAGAGTVGGSVTIRF
jgi:hypothetical protein